MRIFSDSLRTCKTLVLLSLLFFTQTALSEVPVGGYTFGIGPQQSASELAKRWTPIIQYLSEKSGIPLQFNTAKDIPTFQQKMNEGVYDIAYVNPFHYLSFHRSTNGYTAFAKEKEGKLVGVLVVKKDAGINSVQQLNEKIVAFPAANALAATWLPMRMFMEKNVTITPQYVKSMDSVYRSVAKGLFPAGGGEMRTLSTIDADVQDQLKILWTSESLPPFPFAAHSRIPKLSIVKLLKAMEQMDRDPQGTLLLKAINFKGFEYASDADFDDMRTLNIKPIVEAK